MPTAVELDRLRALIAQLVPLTAIQRGDLIRAENWNLVVGALVELARAVTTIETDKSVPEHEHTGDVSLDWLDPKLRQLLERGALDDPIAATRVLQVEQRSLQLNRSIESVGTEMKSLRERLDKAVTSDLVRQNSMVRVTQKVEGIADARNDVTALRQTLAAIGGSVEDAVALRRQLEVDGALVDVRAVSDGLRSLAELKDRLRLPNGQLLDAITIEQRLAETENRFVTRTDLDEILKNRGGKLTPNDLAGITADLRLQLSGDIDGVRKQFEEKLGSEINARFSDVEKLVAQSVAGSIPSVRDSLSATLGAELRAVVKAQDTAVRADMDARVAPLEKTVQKVSDDRAATDKSLSADIGDLTSSVKTSLATLEARLSKQGETQRAEIEKAFETRLSQAIAESARNLSASLDARIQEGVKKGLDGQLRELVDASVKDRMAEMEKSLRASVREEVKIAFDTRGGVPVIDPARPILTGTEDDFTRIPGVGANLAGRLKEKGVNTFKDLSVMAPADVAVLLKKSESDAIAIIKHAQVLARG